MKNTKSIYSIGVLLALSLLISTNGWTEPGPETKGPIITHAFAVDRGGAYGYVWKIYIEAEAGAAPMSRIAMEVDQPGNGRYPIDWVMVKSQHQKELKGYIQWNMKKIQEWTQLTLKVSIFDKAGNESNVAFFPFTFLSGVKDPYNNKPPAPFDQEDMPRLGYIMIDLFGPNGPGW